MALGGLTGLLGRRPVLICTEAVERTVHRHMSDQQRYLEPVDPELAGVIADIQQQELGHLQHAVSGRGRKGAFGRALDWVIVAVTEALLWAATRGDSIRLARDLNTSA